MGYTFRTIAGVLLILLAIITGPIPVVQGWIFFVAAIGVLGLDHPISQFCFRQLARFGWARRQLEKRGWLRREDLPPTS
ncbi:MAG: hypothetical protein RL328_1875 [Acidobacteriota bacterium]|jgi:hypothetical protein